jgi:hypothetical protein
MSFMRGTLLFSRHTQLKKESEISRYFALCLYFLTCFLVLLHMLAVLSVAVTTFTNFCSIMESHVLPTQCIYVFCVDLRTNSDYFTVQH